GVSMLPDDPLRVGAPEGWSDDKERRFSELVQSLAGEYESSVTAVLRGGVPFARIADRQYDGGQLFAAITEGVHDDIKYPLLVGDKSVGKQLIEKWCLEQAH